MAAAGEQTIGTRTLRGVFWAYGSYVAGRATVLLSTVILARVLIPEDFGIVALALTFMAVLQGAKDLGLGQALVVQEDEGLMDKAETAFALSVGLGLLLSIVIAALSPLAADFYREPDLAPLVAVLGLNFFLQSLGSTHYAIAQRRLDFRSRTIAEVADVVVRGSIGIGLALAGFGAWALVIGYLAGTIALDVAIWIRVRWLPRLKPRREHLRALVGFGGTLSAVDIVAVLIANVDYVFIGRALGATALGYYTLGFRLPELLIINLSIVAGTVLYPAFASFERQDLGRAFLVAMRYTMMLTAPMTVGMIILAEPVILALFGDQWTESIEPMRVVALYAFALTVGVPAGTAYKATGRAGVILVIAIGRLIGVTASVAIFVDKGIVAVAACQAAVAVIADATGVYVAVRLLSVRAVAIIRAVAPALLASAVMAPFVYLVQELISAPWPTLIVGTLVGAAVYLGTIRVISPGSIEYLRSRLRRPAAGAPGTPVAGPELKLEE